MKTEDLSYTNTIKMYVHVIDKFCNRNLYEERFIFDILVWTEQPTK